MPLLTTKTNIPPARPELVLRQRLIEYLNVGLKRKLILVSAAAGYGKTTILTQWAHLHEMKEHIAWLSLDKGDNDPVIFWDYFTSALKKLNSGVGGDISSMLHSSRRMPIEAILTELINEINAIQDYIVLVLDDYHMIESMSVHSAIIFLIDHLPIQLHLVIATREDPPLSLAKLRARDLMIEVRANDLRFTSDEVSIFLNQVMKVNVSKDEVEGLETRTEGWITGVQMAALSMRGQKDISGFIKSFTASNRYILDYLIEEVFQQQPENTRAFLLKTSLLDRLTAPLCDFVTERHDSRDMLPTLERANLFIVPLDESRQWYRYEHLFAELLQHQLGMISTAGDISALHIRASQWYENNGIVADSVHHAIAAQDWERVVTLVRTVGDTLMKRGEVATLAGWIKTLPEEVVRAHSEILDKHIWSLILGGQVDTAESYLRHAEKLVQDDPAVTGRRVAIQAYIARVRGDNRLTIELSEKALSLLPQADIETRCIISLNLGMARWQSGNLTEAAEAFTEADYTARESGNEYAAATAKSFLGAIMATGGEFNRAAETLREAASLTTSPAIALGCIYLGALLYEHNELEEASRQLQRGIQLGQQSGNYEIQMGGYRVLAYVLQALNDARGALDSLQKADDIARSTKASSFEHARNASSRVLVALAQGDPSAALQWAEKMSEDGDVSPFYPRLNLTPARLLIAQNRKKEADEQLLLRYQQAAENKWRYGQIETRLLQALAAADPEASLTFLTDALHLAQPERYIRTFLDKGENLITLLYQAKNRGIAPDYINELITIHKRQAEEQKRQARTPAKGSNRPLAEPLSEREMEVLRLLATGLSNLEIAKKLTVSAGTIKTHVHNIINKLDVSGRTQAVAHARELNLI